MTFKANPSYIKTKEDAELFLSTFDNFLLDCDGVIWLSETLIPGVGDFLKYLDDHNKRYAFVTNNSSKSRDAYLTKFHELGLDVAKEQIYTTGYSAVLELQRLGIGPGSKIWVLGDEGIEEELRIEGYFPLGGSDPSLDEEFYPKHPLLTVDPDVRAVVAGSTTRFNFLRCATTLQYLMHNNKLLPYIGTNGDRNYPGLYGLILPAGGALVEHLSFCSDRKYTNVGKPDTVLAETILRNTGFDRLETVMIGDTLTSDIKFGNDAQLGGGHGTMLVLSGVTSFDDLKGLLEQPHHTTEQESLVPKFFVDSLTRLIELLVE
ncbi:4-nitrophenylphosphatase [Candida viswanathii]|uniref:4-nitrophenylphosphatase n=1 Tax=Candida viswanathii TaxID=5486 RepID=A0A367XV07_9ASCO|nr:4-nitrophenylphosphatase [Candida viswanathii]